MATFVILPKWTDKGIEHLGESPSRLQNFKETVEAS